MDIRVYVGADIAAESIQIDWLNVDTRAKQQVTIEQAKRDYAKLVKQLTKEVEAEHIQVIMEATGTY